MLLFLETPIYIHSFLNQKKNDMFINSALQWNFGNFPNGPNLFGFGNVRAFAFQQHGDLFPTRRVFPWKSSSPRTPHPCTKNHTKKTKNSPPPQKKNSYSLFKGKKTFGKKKETFPRCAFLQTWWVDPNRSLVMKGIFLITPPRTTQRQFYGRPVPPPPQRYHRQSSWHSPFAGVLPGRETPSVLAKMSGETQ